MKNKCETCKHYSQLKYAWSDGFAEHWNCQKEHCVFCAELMDKCKDYERGKNDGGTHILDEDEEDEN